MNRNSKKLFIEIFEIKICYNLINVFTVILNQFNVNNIFNCLVFLTIADPYMFG